MAKLTNVRERVHQPFYDTLVRTSGLSNPAVQDTTSLFSNQSRAGDLAALTNLTNGSTLPSDQSYVVLALRCPLWFRSSQIRGALLTAVQWPASNGEFAYAAATGNNAQTFFGTGASGNGPGYGNAPGDQHDVFRLYMQSVEQLHWSFGTGTKESISNLPSSYFPAANGLWGSMAGSSDLILLNNGTPSNTALLRLGRAVLIPPRQNILCTARIISLPGATATTNPGTTDSTTGRNYLSLKDNLNAIDGVQKSISFYFDGLWARDVQ